MLYVEHFALVVASTLSGGVDKFSLPHHVERQSSESNHTFTCGRGTSWSECALLDARVYPLDVLIPWVFTLCWLLVLSMPTVLVRSKHRLRALALLAQTFFEFLGLVMCSLRGTDHPIITYAMTMHSCVRLLTRVQVCNEFVGGRWWWRLRFFGVAQLLVWEVLAGVPVSVVRWGRDPEADQGLACAYLAHLGGCLLPDLVLCALRLLWSMFGSFSARGDD